MISSLSLFKENLKRNIGSMVLLFIFLLMLTIIPALSVYINIENFKDCTSYINQNINVIPFNLSMIILFAYAILNGISGFCYFHNSKQVDFFNSLPIKREGLFFQEYILGIIKVIPIYLINMILLLVIYFFMGFSDYINMTYILKSIILNILLYLSIYSMFVFSTLVTGTRTISVLFGIFIMVFPFIFKILYILFMKSSMYDFNFEIIKALMNILPFNLIKHYSGDFYGYELYKITFFSIILKNCISIIIFIVSSYFLFLNRKSEKSNCAIAFDSFKRPLKYIFTIICSIFIGYLFNIILETDIFGFIIGVFISSLLTASIIEIIYDFDFKAAFKNWQDNIICFIIALIIFFIGQNNFIKDKVEVPKLEDIEFVSAFDSGIFKSDDIKEKVLDLINTGIEDKKDLKQSSEGIKLGYKLKNGDVKYLLFRIKDSNKIREYKEYILNSKEHIQNELERLLKREDSLGIVRILNSFGESKEIFDKEEVKQFVEVYKKDLNNISNQDTSENPLYIFETNVGSFYVYSNYLETLKYIKEKFQLLPKKLEAKDIKYIKLDFLDARIIKNKKDIEFIINNSKTIFPSPNRVTAYVGDDEEKLKQVYLYINYQDYQKVYNYFQK